MKMNKPIRKTLNSILVAITLVLTISCSGSEDSSGTDESACDGVSCSNHGICVIDGTGPICNCHNGYHAEALECLADLCDKDSCLYGYCKDPANSSECICNDGYDGLDCSKCADNYHWQNLVCVADDPSLNPCLPNPCKNEGSCTIVGDGFSCYCDYHFDGDTCEECATGFAGDDCQSCAEGYHVEADECVQNSPCNPDPCAHGECSEVGGNAVCDCETGYEGLFCDRCERGYVMDGLVCVPEDPQDPCIPNPCSEQTHIDNHQTLCENDNGTAVCNCEAGYHEEGESCVEDVTCDPATTCSGHGECKEEGSLECICNEGYAGNNCDSCDEGYLWENDVCILDPTDPCTDVECNEPNRGKCVVVDDDSYTCQCDDGHTDIAGVCAADCDVDASLCDLANPSFGTLVSANGHSAVVVDLDQRKASGLFEHPYKTWGKNEFGQIAHTRNLLFDSYLGVRINGTGTWLNTVNLDYAGYYNQEGIPHLVQNVGDIRIETYLYAPYEMPIPALMMLGKITNTGTQNKEVSAYTLHNYHLGYTDDNASETGVVPDDKDEQIVYDAATGAYKETGPGGALVHFPIGDMSYYGAGADGDSNPWKRLTNGENLGNETDTATGDGRVCGYQKGDKTLAPGESMWIGVVTGLDRSGNPATLLNNLNSKFSSKTPEQVLEGAVTEWENWRKAMPENLSPAEAWVYRVSEAVLRMGQVLETSNNSHGQILASLPPGIWSISWVRDMSYSISALIRSGHYTEAANAIKFMLNANSNTYNSEVGLDYQISVCRYYGNGTEESDHDYNGPNIEYDGFGLFLWVLGEYIDATDDTTILDTYWATIRDKVAGSLVGLIDDNGMIQADSSIWEVHWNGQQKQFNYTSLAAVRGLCEAAKMADTKSDSINRDLYKQKATSIQSAIKTNALDNGFLVQSVEEYVADSGYVDAAVVDAFNWGVFNPQGTIADTTHATFDSNLKAAHGKGYFRNDDGGEYDSKEWVFVDMRIASALRAGGEDAKANTLIDWITAQAINNMGMIAELHSPTTAAYDGAIPMVGFGAGAYIINLWMRAEGVTVEPACWDSWQE